MRKIIVLPFAEQDVKDSVNHYREKGIERQFLSIINHAFSIISANPFSFPLIKKPIRKFVIKDFPFNVYYVVEEECIYILAVFHNKRNPRIWKTRKSK